MYRQSGFRLNLAKTVDSITHNVKDTSANHIADRHLDRLSCRCRLDTTLKAVRGVHGNTSYGIFSDMLLHLNNKGSPVLTLHLQGIINGRHTLDVIKMDINYRTYNL